MVSPLGLQEGAEKIAAAENIVSVTLNAYCTTSEFVMRFLNQFMLGVTDRASAGEHVQVEVVRPNSH